MGSCSFYEAWPGSIDYDSWKLASPYDEDESDRGSLCTQCDDEGWIFSGPDDEDGVEPCTCCSSLVELDDLEPLLPTGSPL